jgi:predicted GNAT family N-acyltransferase
MFEIFRFDSTDNKKLKASLDLRTEVFVKEQGVDPVLEYDDHDSEAHHYLCEHYGMPVGTGRWRMTPEGIKLERFAVCVTYRGQGVGGLILKAMLEDIIPLKKKIYMHAQATAAEFYRHHGFITEGELFYEAGIAHYKMIWGKP